MFDSLGVNDRSNEPIENMDVETNNARVFFLMAGYNEQPDILTRQPATCRCFENSLQFSLIFQ